MMTSLEGFTKYHFLIGGYEYKMNINEIMSSLYAEIITLCFLSPEVFTQIFSAVLTKEGSPSTTGREQLIWSHSSAKLCFELSGNSN